MFSLVYHTHTHTHAQTHTRTHTHAPIHAHTYIRTHANAMGPMRTVQPDPDATLAGGQRTQRTTMGLRDHTRLRGNATIRTTTLSKHNNIITLMRHNEDTT
eukprot:GHVU01176636.1.p2 GENE.GHVU01176636.1~~GHVU01176636.1.p2  ORF type:complete len:101 (+),score=4.43 GHVU01176636.1:38-340(+)